MSDEYAGIATQMKGVQKQANGFYNLVLMKKLEPKKYAILMIKKQPFFSDPPEEQRPVIDVDNIIKAIDDLDCLIKNQRQRARRVQKNGAYN